jgi:hypothetical protein
MVSVKHDPNLYTFSSIFRAAFKETGTRVYVKQIRILPKTKQIHMRRLPPRFESLSAGLLSRSPYASRRPCDRLTRSRLSMVFLGPRENSELMSSVSQNDSYATLTKSALNHNLTVSYVMDFL